MCLNHILSILKLFRASFSPSFLLINHHCIQLSNANEACDASNGFSVNFGNNSCNWAAGCRSRTEGKCLSLSHVWLFILFLTKKLRQNWSASHQMFGDNECNDTPGSFCPDSCAPSSSPSVSLEPSLEPLTSQVPSTSSVPSLKPSWSPKENTYFWP